MDSQRIHENAITQVDDESLLNTIQSADLHQAWQLLEGNNYFSQDGLDRALISACRHGLKYLVQTLVRLGANVQFKDTQGNTPLLICAENGFIDIVHFLLKKRADVNAFNSAGDTALILSIRAAGSLEMVRVLLEQEWIDISHQNQDGYTALMKAVEVGDVDVIKILMERYNEEKTNGDLKQDSNLRSLKPIDAVNLSGMSAEQIADECGFGNIYHILKAHIGANVSPLVIAIEERDINSLNTFLNCHFVLKRDMQVAFKKLLKLCVKKKGKFFHGKENAIIKRLFTRRIEIDTSGFGGSYLLYFSVRMEDYGLVELLCQYLDHHQNLRSQCSSQALVAAVLAGRCDLVQLLLKYKADFNNNNNYSGSPLDCALRHGHLESAKLLLQHGAKIDIGCALKAVTTQQGLEGMKLVFEKCQSEVINFVTTEGTKLINLLVSAARDGNREIIGHLLHACAGVTKENVYREKPQLYFNLCGTDGVLYWRRGMLTNSLHDGTSLLQMILNYREVSESLIMEGVKVLLENGASVNERGNDGRTPIMVATRGRKSVGLLQFLLDLGADINAQDKEGATALTLSVKVGNLKTVKELIDFGADVNVRDMNGNTPLMQAVTERCSSWAEILGTLIKAGSDVNCQNNDGFSPLMQATRNGWNDVIQTLLDSGADVNAVSVKDQTKTALSFLPDSFASRPDFKNCLQAFLTKGAFCSFIKPYILHKMILCKKDIDLIPELIQGGVGPVDVEAESLSLVHVGRDVIPAVSPLCVALLVGNVSLARFFVGNMFLTNSDVTSLAGNRNLRGLLENRLYQPCLTFLDELSFQPWSLFQLAFVSVSSAVGSSPGRENRVSLLPLPQIMKDKLLFR